MAEGKGGIYSSHQGRKDQAIVCWNVSTVPYYTNTTLNARRGIAKGIDEPQDLSALRALSCEDRELGSPGK